jgi:hypothetical protein
VRPENRTSQLALIEALVSHDVQFVVVGGVSAVIRGAPIVTYDLDVIHKRSPENVVRLLAALDSLKATYRHDSRGLKPGESHLMSRGHQLLGTTFGPLDCLGSIGKGGTLSYDDMLRQSDEVDLDGMRAHVLRLREYVRLKEELGREKDVAVLPVLRQTLLESGQ